MLIPNPLAQTHTFFACCALDTRYTCTCRVREDWGEYSSCDFSIMAVMTDCLIFLLVFLPVCYSKPFNASRTLSPDNETKIKHKKAPNLLEDHIKGLKLERDGHVNKDYHHEAFLGKMVEDGTLIFDNMDGYRRLIDLFHKVDKDDDHKVSKAELTVWIHEKIKEHIQEARDNNHQMFKVVDRDGDGFVSWMNYDRRLRRITKLNRGTQLS